MLLCLFSEMANGKSFYDWFILHYGAKIKIVIGFDGLLCTIGTFVNLWFLWSILSSVALRRTLRNQLICNLIIAHLFQTLILSPAEIAYLVDILNPPWTQASLCNTETVESIIGHIQSALADWLVVFLVGTFCASSLRLNLAAKITPRCSTALQVAMHIFPWILVVTVTSVSIQVLFGPEKCHNIPSSQRYVYETMYTILPTCISILLLIICVAKRNQATSPQTSMARQQLETAPETDRLSAYVVMIIIVILCEIASILVNFQRKSGVNI